MSHTRRLIGIAAGCFFALFSLSVQAQLSTGQPSVTRPDIPRLAPIKAVPQETVWTGTWETNEGNLRLVSHQGYIFGDYAERGVILAKAQGSVLRGFFVYDDGEGNIDEDRWGTFLFTLDGDDFSGKWKWGGPPDDVSADSAEWRGNWSGSKASADRPDMARADDYPSPEAVLPAAASEEAGWLDGPKLTFPEQDWQPLVNAGPTENTPQLDPDALPGTLPAIELQGNGTGLNQAALDTMTLQPNSWEGTWQTSRGVVSLLSDGVRVWGEYDDTGIIAGFVNGNTVRATFSETNADGTRPVEGQWGFLEITIIDGKFLGRWRWREIPTRSRYDGFWSGRKESGGAPTLSRQRIFMMPDADYAPEASEDQLAWVRFEEDAAEDASAQDAPQEPGDSAAAIVEPAVPADTSAYIEVRVEGITAIDPAGSQAFKFTAYGTAGVHAFIDGPEGSSPAPAMFGDQPRVLDVPRAQAMGIGAQASMVLVENSDCGIVFCGSEQIDVARVYAVPSAVRRGEARMGIDVRSHFAYAGLNPRQDEEIGFAQTKLFLDDLPAFKAGKSGTYWVRHKVELENSKVTSVFVVFTVSGHATLEDLNGPADIKSSYVAGGFDMNDLQRTEGELDNSLFQACQLAGSSNRVLSCDLSGRRWYLDMTLCEPGSLEHIYPIVPIPVERTVGCSPSFEATGSAVDTCRFYQVLAGSAIGQETQNAGCEGPRLSMTGRGLLGIAGTEIRARLHNERQSSKTWYFEQLPTLIDHRYVTNYRVSSCPGRRFWNDRGVLTCAP